MDYLNISGNTNNMLNHVGYNVLSCANLITSDSNYSKNYGQGDFIFTVSK